MKAFAFDSIEKYTRFSDFRNIKKSLCNKPWQAFSESGDKETYTFMPNGTLIITINGKSLKGMWQCNQKFRTLVISSKTQSHTFNIAYYDSTLLAMHIERSSEYVFLINTGNDVFFSPKIYSDIISYLRKKEAVEEAEISKLADDPNSILSHYSIDIANKVIERRQHKAIKSEASDFYKNINRKYRHYGKIAVFIICILIYTIYFFHNYTSLRMPLGEAVIDALFYGTIINLIVCALCLNLFIAKALTHIHIYLWKMKNPQERIGDYL